MLGETLAAELVPFSIRVLIVEPGAFRTQSPTFTNPPETPVRIPDYDNMRKEAQKRVEGIYGKEPGDPKKAMNLLADVVRGEGRAREVLERYGWPLYLPIGKEAEDGIRGKFNKLNEVLDTWGELIRDTRLDEMVIEGKVT